MARKKIVLSIDGGGIRGIIPAQILIHFERLLKEVYQDSTYKIADYFDLIAGTSTGGILGIAYLMPDFGRPMYSAEQVLNLYFDRGEDIFDIPFYHKLVSAGGLLDEKYPDKGLQETLLDYFGDVKLNQLLKPTLITSYDIKRRKAHFFTQHRAEDPKYNFLVRDVARATAAAPTYFEPARIRSENKDTYPLIDGGVFANNPSMCAYAEMRHSFSTPDRKVCAADIKILSLGTGIYHKPMNFSEVKDWGASRWAKPLVDIMMSGIGETVDYELTQLFDSIDSPEQYLRVNGELPDNTSPDLDNVEPANLKALQEFGNQLFFENQEKILEFIKSD